MRLKLSAGRHRVDRSLGSRCSLPAPDSFWSVPPVPPSRRAAAATLLAASSVLRIAVTQPPDPFDPATLSDNRSIELAQNVFDGLVDVNDQMNIVPAIAKSWTIGDGGTLYTFNLRHGRHLPER